MYELEDFNGIFDSIVKKMFETHPTNLRTNLHRTYDQERYEIVEKKDWKAKQLKVRIDYKKDLIEEHKRKIKFYTELIKVNTEALHKLEKELKELE